MDSPTAAARYAAAHFARRSIRDSALATSLSQSAQVPPTRGEGVILFVKSIAPDTFRPSSKPPCARRTMNTTWSPKFETDTVARLERLAYARQVSSSHGRCPPSPQRRHCRNVPSDRSACFTAVTARVAADPYFAPSRHSNCPSTSRPSRPSRL